jgi:hypothetical protein
MSSKILTIYEYPGLLAFYVVVLGLYGIGLGVIVVGELYKRKQGIVEKHSFIIEPQQYIVSIKTNDPNFYKCQPRITLIGTKGESTKEALNGWFQPGNFFRRYRKKDFIIYTEQLGNITGVSVENKHLDAKWHCIEIKVLLWETRKVWKFTIDRDVDGNAVFFGPSMHRRTIRMFQIVYLELASSLQEEHIITSIFLKPNRSSFGRAARLSLLIYYILTTMFINALFFNVASGNTVLAIISNAFYSWLITNSAYYLFVRMMEWPGSILTVLSFLSLSMPFFSFKQGPRLFVDSLRRC